jgi:hypothetical protein
MCVRYAMVAERFSITEPPYLRWASQGFESLPLRAAETSCHFFRQRREGSELMMLCWAPTLSYNKIVENSGALTMGVAYTKESFPQT